MPWPWRRPRPEAEPAGGARGEIVARLLDGPAAGHRCEVRPIEGRPPKTVVVPDREGGAWRYGLEAWEQRGHGADYVFLHRLDA